MDFALRSFFWCTTALWLTACGGGATSSGSLSTSGANDPSPTDPRFLPTSGSASYNGFMSLQLPSAPEPGSSREAYTGTLGLAVEFGPVSGQLAGEASGFRGPGGTLLDGRIFVTDGTLDRSASIATDYTFEAGVSGTLDGGGLRNSVVTGTMTGDFIGGSADTVTGVTFGSVTTVLGVDLFDGSFAATRN